MIESFYEKLCCFEDKTRIWNLEEDQQKICKCCGLMYKLCMSQKWFITHWMKHLLSWKLDPNIGRTTSPNLFGKVIKATFLSWLIIQLCGFLLSKPSMEPRWVYHISVFLVLMDFIEQQPQLYQVS
jgi:hypothetical protein